MNCACTQDLDNTMMMLYYINLHTHPIGAGFCVILFFELSGPGVKTARDGSEPSREDFASGLGTLFKALCMDGWRKVF
jgi:hypothetical protein